MRRTVRRQTTRGIVLTLASAAALAAATPVHAQDRDVDRLAWVSSQILRDLDRIIQQSVESVTTGPLRDVTRDVVRDVVRDVMRDMEPLLNASGLPSMADQGRDFRTERVDRSTRTLPLGPNGSLELKNVSGDITVTGGSGREVVLEVVRRSRARTETDAALGLKDVQVAVDHRGERASVDIVYPRGNRPYQVTATYAVTAPAGTRITARSVSGSVNVKGIQGDVAAETVSGAVSVSNSGRVSRARSVSGSVTLTDIGGESLLSAGTVSGNVLLQRVQARRLAVDVISGDIRADDVTCDSAQLKSLSGSVEYLGRLARSGRYELNSHSGSVRLIAEGPVGFELQASTFSGRIRPEGLSLQSLTSSRGSLRATVGDGSAVVVAGTFSGDVVIGRK